MDTLGKKRRKVELEGLMDEIQHYIYMMRGSKPIRKADFRRIPAFENATKTAGGVRKRPSPR